MTLFLRSLFGSPIAGSTLEGADEARSTTENETEPAKEIANERRLTDSESAASRPSATCRSDARDSTLPSPPARSTHRTLSAHRHSDASTTPTPATLAADAPAPAPLPGAMHAEPTATDAADQKGHASTATDASVNTVATVRNSDGNSTTATATATGAIQPDKQSTANTQSTPNFGFSFTHSLFSLCSVRIAYMPF